MRLCTYFSYIILCDTYISHEKKNLIFVYSTVLTRAFHIANCIYKMYKDFDLAENIVGI